MVALGREKFLAIAPPFTGDILWEHLEILQKGKLKKHILKKYYYISNLYGICLPIRLLPLLAGREMSS